MFHNGHGNYDVLLPHANGMVWYGIVWFNVPLDIL